MQPLGLTGAALQAYHDRLFSSHDYRIDVDVLDLNENPRGTISFLDGQINLQGSDQLIRRTASLAVSDPTGALDFTAGSTWSGSTVWVDRLVRVRHTIHVPALNRDVTATPFIGPPSAISRNGAEVSLELQDKAALAARGASPLTVTTGMNAVAAIRKILAQCTGEFRFRLGTSKRRLSKDYSVGWDDSTSPLLVAMKIARAELGMQLIYSCDGYATLRRRPTTGRSLLVPHVTAEPEDGVDFTTLANWVKVSGKKTEKTKGNTTTTTQPVATAVVTKGNLAPANLQRQGVPRYLPLLIDDESYTTVAQVKTRATVELDRASRLQQQPAFTCVPFFHADVDDRVQFDVPGQDVTVALASSSIPLGPNEMTVGAITWVSAPPGSRSRGHKTKAVTHTKSKKKGTHR